MKAILLVATSLFLALAAAQSTDNQSQSLGNADTASNESTSPEQAVEDGNAEDDDQGVDTEDSSANDPQDQGLYEPNFGDLFDRRSFVPLDVLDGHHHDYYGLAKREPMVIERRGVGGGFHYAWPHEFGTVGGFGRFGGVARVGGVFKFPTFFANQNRLNLRKKKLQKFRFKNRRNKHFKAAHRTKFFS
ncbi:hypothetical protein H4R34_004538 [Dimargaris verticillata]|uniref:Uncharacterized protein n=1 Tax=Dimargaris verticillata TaxID=2761393 RepID=A0A9W8EC43_9FUNG|nr:hypothetical protein H4R34_004538 [Dimargaris verticillata]